MNEEKVETSAPVAPAPAAVLAPAKKEAKAHRNMATLIVVALAALGLMLWRVDSELTHLSVTLQDISEDVRSSEPAKTQPEQPKEAVVSQKVVKTKSGLLMFTQTCMASVNVSESENLPYCLGENVLKVSVDGDKPAEVDRSTAADAATAPVLTDLSYVEQSGNVLVSYGPQPCVMPGGACLGGSEARVTMVTDASALTTRKLANYPNVIGSDITYYWNSEGTKVAAVYGTCGEGGCTAPKPIQGYNLATDALTVIATAGEEFSKLPDQPSADGLPKWTLFAWNSPTEFTATITDVKGKNTEVKGKME